MSDLQTSLLVVGGFLIAGVYLFNWWQERQFQRRAESAFPREHTDVLLQGAAKQGGERVDPMLPVETAATVAARPAAGTPVAAVIDPVIDYVVEVDIQPAADGVELQQELLALAAGWGKPVLVAGYDPRHGEWREAGAGSGMRCPQLRFALQMSNRGGCVEQVQLAAFRDSVLGWAARHQGKAKCQDVAEAYAMAAQLDRFCAGVDIAIGINVMAGDGNPFPGAGIQAQAELAGLRLGPDGVFHALGERGEMLFSLDNNEPMPFMPEQMKTLFTSGVSFLLDVPRIETALRVFDVMHVTAGNFAAALDGTLADDNGRALTERAIDEIRRQLEGILAKLEAAQIPAGSARALRLFS